jgi:hypothetical protein
VLAEGTSLLLIVVDALIYKLVTSTPESFYYSGKQMTMAAPYSPSDLFFFYLQVSMSLKKKTSAGLSSSGHRSL